ncbi:hypothetical protein QJS66_18230 [Kocuria rhizophila]|nr:hypothetical protein QJS66_18230 [Kocuria rhizophila]
MARRCSPSGPRSARCSQVFHGLHAAATPRRTRHGSWDARIIRNERKIPPGVTNARATRRCESVRVSLAIVWATSQSARPSRRVLGGGAHGLGGAPRCPGAERWGFAFAGHHHVRAHGGDRHGGHAPAGSHRRGSSRVWPGQRSAENLWENSSL